MLTFIALNYTFIIQLEAATWHEAIDLCPSYGKGFYLASFNSMEEQNEIQPLLTELKGKVSPICIELHPNTA